MENALVLVHSRHKTADDGHVRRCQCVVNVEHRSCHIDDIRSTRTHVNEQIDDKRTHLFTYERVTTTDDNISIDILIYLVLAY
jgi:hypothetical protein